MRTSRKANAKGCGNAALAAWLFLWLALGIVFLTLGVRSLLPLNPPDDSGWLSLVQPNPSDDPGWPFAIIGSLMICVSWAVLLCRYLVLALMPLALLGLLSIGAGTYTAWCQHRKVTTYKPVEAWVLWAQVEYRVIKHEDGNPHVYTPTVRYEYDVAGQTFSSGTVYPMPWSFVDPFESQGLAREILERVTPGLSKGIHRLGPITAEADPTKAHRVKPSRARAYPVEAYYDPRHPADSFLIKRYSWLPFAMILGVMGPLLVIGFILVRHSSLEDGSKQAARWLVVIVWHTTGLLVAAHCLFIVLWGSGMVSPAVAYIVAVYEVIGLVPLGITLPRNGWPGKIKAALATGGIMGMLVGLVSLPIAGVGGAVVNSALAFVSDRPVNIVPWALLVALIVSCAAAVVAAVVELVRRNAFKRR